MDPLWQRVAADLFEHIDQLYCPFPPPGAVALRLSAPAARLLRERGLEKAEVLARPRARAAANERGVVDYAALKAILDGASP